VKIRSTLGLLGGSAIAGIALGLMVLPDPPRRDLAPVVAISPAARTVRSPQDRALSQRLSRYSARATPAWIQLGFGLTSDGHHDLAELTESARQELQQARSADAPDLLALHKGQKSVLDRIRAERPGQDPSQPIDRLVQALSQLTDAKNAASPSVLYTPLTEIEGLGIHVEGSTALGQPP
jgi:hypothetical protein